MEFWEQWKERRALRKKYRPPGAFFTSYDRSLYECTNKELEAVKRYILEENTEDTPGRRYFLALLSTIPERGDVFRAELDRLTQKDKGREDGSTCPPLAGGTRGPL